METAVFKGLFEINGEAVLFFEQENSGRRKLVRLRFGSDSGNLLEEMVMGESKGQTKKTDFFVMKNNKDDNYAILYSMESAPFKQCELHVTYYNNKHEAYRTVPLDVDRKKYDYLYVAGAQYQPNGVCVLLNLTTLVTNQTASSVSPEKALYDHDIAIYYIPEESGKVRKTVVNVSTYVYPNYTKYTFNPFANTLNLLLYSYRTIRYKFDMNIQRGAIDENLFFISDLNSGGIKLNYVNNDSATAILRQKKDTTKVFLWDAFVHVHKRQWPVHYCLRRLRPVR